jgi:hypothetical protein
MGGAVVIAGEVNSADPAALSQARARGKGVPVSTTLES